MATPLIDVHVHLSESKEIGAWSKAAYEIWEYGRFDHVRFGPASGDLGEFRDAMRAGGLDHAVVVNAFSVDEWRGRWLAGLDDHRRVAGRSLGARLIEFNEWLVGSVGAIPEITPFVAVDPWVLSYEETAAHLADMRERGALGVKVHPIDQRFVVSDEHMVRIGRRCAELGLVVLSHSGTSRGGVQFADPDAFAGLAGAVTGLRLVLAHLGGGSWRQIGSIARRFQNIAFDLSEIVAWLGAPSAPSEEELVALVHEIGHERVMFGSDFPWYDPGEMIKIVRSLPGFNDDELDGILGGNAAGILRLPV